jgi:beta-glucuronidase
MVWSEIPVYWTILWENQNTYENAQNQLCEMITRDKNRAAVIIWSVANETPKGNERMKFLSRLIDKARELDDTRLISAATEISHEDGFNIVNDPLIEHLDVIGVNEYHGWYGGKPEDTPEIKWKSLYNKPLIISEFGGGAKYGYHGSKDEIWTEEYQEYLYQQQIKMLTQISFLRGMSPWILKDFRSPRRPLPKIQDFWNRKGLLSEKGEKKKAFFVLQNFYNSIQTKEK